MSLSQSSCEGLKRSVSIFFYRANDWPQAAATCSLNVVRVSAAILGLLLDYRA